tara:strand:+ start:244 stop:579 length:336 start_codon:yes stop_codon:yes gene_type:complete
LSGKRLSIGVASLRPIYELAQLEKSISRLYLEHYFVNHPDDERIIEGLSTVYTIAVKQSEAIERMAHGSLASVDSKVQITTGEIHALAIIALESLKVQEQLATANISFFLQ